MHPELIQTKYFVINTLWVFFAGGIIAATYTLIKLSTKNGLKIQFLSEHSWKIILWGLIGARVLSLIENFSTYFYEFSANMFLQVFQIWDKGLNFWGATLAILVYLFLICKKHEQDFWKWLDVIIPSIIVGLAIGHIGTFFEGSNYGRETSLPWGVNFESPAIKYTVPIHPTQIYAFLYASAIATGLILSEKIKILKKAGSIGVLGIITYNLFFFLEQFVRGDDTMLIFGIRFPQIISAIVLIASGIFLYKFLTQKT